MWDYGESNRCCSRGYSRGTSNARGLTTTTPKERHLLRSVDLSHSSTIHHRKNPLVSLKKNTTSWITIYCPLGMIEMMPSHSLKLGCILPRQSRSCKFRIWRKFGNFWHCGWRLGDLPGDHAVIGLCLEGLMQVEKKCWCMRATMNLFLAA